MIDTMEVHFLELPKLNDEEVKKDESDPLYMWMSFLNSESREVMQMLAQKDEDIRKAYDLLEVISQDENARMIYEARMKEISDEKTRIISAKEEGREQGWEEEARNAVYDNLSDLADYTIYQEKIVKVLNEINDLETLRKLRKASGRTDSSKAFLDRLNGSGQFLS